MAVPPGELVVAPQGPQHRQPDGGDRGAHRLLVAVAAQSVEHHPGQAHTAPEGVEAVHHRGDRVARRRGVDDEDHGGGQRGGDLCGRRRGAVGGTVEKTHHPFDDEQIFSRSRPGSHRRDPVEPAHPGVDVAGRRTRGQGVVAGVDVVGTDLGGTDAHASRGESGHQTGGDGGLAYTRMGSGDDNAGRQGTGDHGRVSTRCPSGPRCPAGRRVSPGSSR